MARSSHIDGRVSTVPSLPQETLKYGFEKYEEYYYDEYKDSNDVINKAGVGSHVLHVFIGELDRLSHHDKRFGDKFGVLGDLDKGTGDHIVSSKTPPTGGEIHEVHAILLHPFVGEVSASDRCHHSPILTWLACSMPYSSHPLRMADTSIATSS